MRRSVPVVGLILALVCCLNTAQAQLPPACWTEARMLSMGDSPDEFKRRISLRSVDDALGQPLIIEHSGPNESGLIHGRVVVSDRRNGSLQVEIERMASKVIARRIGERLLYLRIAWSRTTFSDVLIRIESASVVSHDLTVDGQTAMEQAKASCALAEMAELPACQCPDHAAADPALIAGSASASIIGLLTLPELSGSAVETATPSPIQLLPGPDALDASGRLAASTGQLEWREYAYEARAAVVLDQKNGWFELRLNSGETGWYQASKDNRFYPLEQLFEKRLSYLTPAWRGRLWQPIGHRWTSRPFEPFDAQERDVIIYASRRDAQGLWFEIGILESSPCDGSDSGIVDRGWVPAWNRSGRLNLWFYSRGC